MSEPTISFEDARAACKTVWPDEETARKQAAKLSSANWRVIPRHQPTRFGKDGLMIVASAYHPVTYSCPGDLMYRAAS